MLIQISEKSRQAFLDAANKLGRTEELPIVSMLPEDIALYLIAVYMLTTIIEAKKDGKVYDITDQDVRKYEPWFYVKEGYKPGSGSGFSFRDSYYSFTHSYVGARLSSNSSEDSRLIATEYPDLWEIFILNVK